MISIAARVLVLSCAITSNLTQAQDSNCLFGANQPATVQIEFKYRTTADGTGEENGSGFIISPSGYVLTNAHVVSPKQVSPDMKIESATIRVRVGSLFKAPIEAEIVHRDTLNDLALLRLPQRQDGWPTVAVGFPNSIAVGSKLIAMGFPEGGDLAIVPNGEKTAHNAVVDTAPRPWWQTNLAMNRGNSGGPVFGQLGTVVGVAVAKNSNAQQLTYVIPISQAQHLLDIAEVKSVTSARCAMFPECRHPSHPVERYVVDELVSRWGDWRSGGYNQPAYCRDLLNSLQRDYPQSHFSFVRSDENSKKDLGGHVEYRYFCEYRRREQPVFLLKRSAACLN